MTTLLVALAGCSDDADTTAPPPGPETYVLVHGAFAGAWNWEGIVDRIEAAGDRAVTLDLPAHGDDPTAAEDATLQDYTDEVVAKLDAEGAPVMLVGHSMGGLVISQAAEARPDKVKKLVYVAAFLVPDDTSLLEAGSGDMESTLQMYVTLSSDGLTGTLAEDGILGAFCNDCDAAQVDEIAMRLRPEPLAGFTTKIHTTMENWGRVPRVYIETTDDHAIGPARQKELYEALPCETVITIDSGHCPFLTKPDELAQALLSL
jgi:pimeloyl-ACP methyl ester carboxylesterase